jgi:catechol 2,3-dioxygenase-like lactoylglutathione lyase family enzyme
MKFAGGVCFITDDVRRLAEFYVKILQTEADINDIHVDIPLDGGGLVIYSKAAAINDMGFDFGEYSGTGLCKITFFVDDADAEYERLGSSVTDIGFIIPPTTYPWGARAMHFRDPDGNIVCFAQLPRTMGDDARIAPKE